jgi:hypothetical protein
MKKILLFGYAMLGMVLVSFAQYAKLYPSNWYT